MAYAKTSERREKRLLREQMRSMGLGYRDIAAEFARRYRLRVPGCASDALGHSGLDQCTSMFAPCLLGRPGTPRYAPALPGIRSAVRMQVPRIEWQLPARASIT
jgi:hypothetical protein